MNLDTAQKYLQIVLGEAMTTSNCDITASFATVGTTTFLLGASSTVSNGTTPVTVVAPPVFNSGTQRQVKEIRLHNNDTVTHHVTLQLVDTGNTRIVDSEDVKAGGDYLYTPEGGSSLVNPAPAVLVESGAAETISAMSAASLLDGTEIVPLVQSGGNVRSTVAGVLNYAVINATTPIDMHTANVAAAANSEGADFFSGDTSGSGITGSVSLGTGAASGTGVVTGDSFVYTGSAAAGSSGRVVLNTGSAVGAGKVSGDIAMTPGLISGGATRGNVTMVIPTSAPATSGALWSNLGVVMRVP